MRQVLSIVVFNDRGGGWFSKAQRFFTRMKPTHTAVIIEPLFGLDTILEAKEAVAVTALDKTIENKKVDYKIFRLKGLEKQEVHSIAFEAYLKYAGKTYGFPQLLRFVFRWLAETLRIDVRKGHWFSEGIICSELGYQVMMAYAQQIGDWTLINKLNEWNPNSFHSGDVLTICEMFPNRFELSEQRWS